MATTIYDNQTAGVVISADGDNFYFLCYPSVDAVCADAFKQVNGIRTVRDDGNIVWTLDRKNPVVGNYLDQMTGTKNFSTPTPAPPQASILDQLQSMSMGGPPAAEAPTYPKLVYNNETMAVQIVDYSEYSVAIFCPKDSPVNNEIKAARGTDGQPLAKFNFKLKNSATTEDKHPAWVFKKSDPATAAFLKRLTGQDIMTLVTSVPARKSYQSKYQDRSGWKPQEPAPEFKMPATEPVSENKTPLNILSSLLDTVLQTEPGSVAEMPLLDERGLIRVGFYGPKAQVTSHTEEYMKTYPSDLFETTVELEATIRNVMAVIIVRNSVAKD